MYNNNDRNVHGVTDTGPIIDSVRYKHTKAAMEVKSVRKSIWVVNVRHHAVGLLPVDRSILAEQLVAPDILEDILESLSYRWLDRRMSAQHLAVELKWGQYTPPGT